MLKKTKCGCIIEDSSINAPTYRLLFRTCIKHLGAEFILEPMDYITGLETEELTDLEKAIYDTEN